MSEAVGQIVTFYSYKGGVGRTMSLANVAFMAACAGKKVLVMDWDLEAPGLLYYFKNLLTSEDAKRIKDAPGVLDMLHRWRDAVAQPELSQDGIEELLNSYEQGDAFEPYVKTIASHPYVTGGGYIDYMGPGAKLILGQEERLYAEALARFSWSEFFDDLRGGLLLNYLRIWGKKTYDYVLIDSRTGYADVSGICTTQLPDTVALCFILNRQNIDGMARVAGSISLKRGAEVKIRPAPMRTTREGSSEESDALARASMLLHRGSGLTLDQIQADLRQLKVKQADGVPFNESLANFYAQDQRFDVAVANYVQLTNYLLGTEISQPQIDSEVLQLVKRRSSPQQATSEFLASLDLKEPARAAEELQGLLEAAIDDARDECQFSADYQRALVDVSFQLTARPSEGATILAVQMQAIVLCYEIAIASSSTEWATTMLEYIDAYMQHVMFALDPTDEQNLLSELDEFAERAQDLTPQAILTRLAIYRRTARINLQLKQPSDAARNFGFLNILIDHAQSIYTSPTQAFTDSLLISQMDVHTIGGDMHDQMGEPYKAIAAYENALKISPREIASDRELERERIKVFANQKLARLLARLNDARAIDYVLASARTSVGQRQSLSRAPEFLPILIRFRATPSQLIEYVNLVFGQSDPSERYFLSIVFSASNDNTPPEFLRLCTELVARMNESNAIGSADATRRVAMTIEVVLRSLLKRRGITSNKDMNEIDNAVREFASVVEHYTGDGSLASSLFNWRAA